jgi:hypothetical protein
MPPAFNLSQDQTLQFNLCFNSFELVAHSRNIGVLPTFCLCELFDAFSLRFAVNRAALHFDIQAPTLIGCWFLKSELHRSPIARIPVQQRNEIMAGFSYPVNSPPANFFTGEPLTISLLTPSGTMAQSGGRRTISPV